MQFLLLEEIFTAKYYAIPDYQRDYEWGTTQITTMLDDIFNILENTPSEPHFFGALVTIPYDVDNATTKSIDFKEYNIDTDLVKHIVDGQQRLTSFSLLLIAIVELLEKDDSLNVKLKERFIHRLKRCLLGDDYSNASPLIAAPRLILNNDTGSCYNHILHEEHPDGDGRLKGPKRLSKTLKLFKEEIYKKVIELEQSSRFNNRLDIYQEIIKIITKNLQFVEIDCTSASNAFQVFDSLNGKGLDLTASDRIRNIFISWAPKGYGADYWETINSKLKNTNLTNFFISLFFYSTDKRIPKNKLPEEFKNKYNKDKDDFKTFYANLLNNASIYGELKNYNKPDKIKSILLDFNELRFEQIYVLLFAIVLHYGENIIKTKDFLQFIQKALNLVIRMQVCDMNMNKLDAFFTICIKKMKNEQCSLNDLIKDICAYGKSTVKDELFKVAFKTLSTNDSKIVNIYLRHLETYLRIQNGNQNKVSRNLTIEHIIPQNVDLNEWYNQNPLPPNTTKELFKELYTENIGNKLLLCSADNISASNNYYTKKIDVYENGTSGENAGNPKSTFLLVEQLLKKYPNQFTHKEVEQRAEDLSKLALKTWAF